MTTLLRATIAFSTIVVSSIVVLADDGGPSEFLQRVMSSQENIERLAQLKVSREILAECDEIVGRIRQQQQSDPVTLYVERSDVTRLCVACREIQSTELRKATETLPAVTGLVIMGASSDEKAALDRVLAFYNEERERLHSLIHRLEAQLPRIWTSNRGTPIVAELVELDSERAVLHRLDTDAAKPVHRNRLSPEDQAFLNALPLFSRTSESPAGTR